MQYCVNCGNIMMGVMSFSKDKHEKFCRCPKCNSETWHIKINDNELSFGEILHREIKKGE
jgi:NAD-dependent SIR2 family protein deacetylase